MMQYTNSKMREAIDECVHNEKHRDILKRRLIDGWTYERIAEDADRTPRQVRNIMERYTATLYDYLRLRS